VSSSPNQRMKIGDFLLRRLNEAGVRHLFGVPSDYNLELLQQLQDSGALKWIGTCNPERPAESTERPMSQLNDLSRSLVILEQDATLIARGGRATGSQSDCRHHR
jgi:indolepyruvate decarboxylase